MILTSSLLVHYAKSCAGCSRRHRFTATTPNDAFGAFKEDTRLIIDDYTNLEIIEELKIKGFHTSLTALEVLAIRLALPASVWDPGSVHSCLRGSDQYC